MTPAATTFNQQIFDGLDKLQDNLKLEQVVNDLEVKLAEEERRFHKLGREIELDDDRIVINHVMLEQLDYEVRLVEQLHMESVKDVSVSAERLQGIKNLLVPMTQYLENDEYTRSIDPLAHNNRHLVSWTDEKRQEMYNLAKVVGDQLRAMNDKVGFMVEQINQRNQYDSQNFDDPIQEITKALNLQLTSLKWAEQKSKLIQERVQAIQSRRLLTMQSNRY